MPDASELSEARRALLERYLRGELSQETRQAVSVITRQVKTPAEDSRAPIKAVQTAGSKRPFFFLHGDWTANSLFSFSLARELGPDQPFYSLDPYKFDGLHILPTTEEVAAEHLKTIRTVQPAGPYLLGGFCNGGLLAYEMARQLYAAGQKVDLLVLMDSIPTRYILLCTIISRFCKLLHLGQDKALDWFLRLQHLYRYMRDRSVEDFEYLKTIDPRITRFFPPVETLRLCYPAMFIWSTAHYKPGFYPGKVTLFWEEAEPERQEWWDRMAKGKDEEVEVHIIPGTHDTCKTTQIGGMAEHLRACLSKATVLK